MSDTTIPAPPPLAAFVPRDEQVKTLAVAMAAVRRAEVDRRFNLAAGAFAGWAAAALATGGLCFALSVLKNRPVPQDRMWVSVLHTDGTQEPTRLVADLTPTERTAIASKTVFDYVDWRVGYTWEAIRKNYDRVQAISVGDARTDYTKEMFENNDRPTLLLGERGSRSAEIGTVSQIGPNAWEVVYTRKMRDRAGVLLPEQRRRVRMSTATLEGMPAPIAYRFSPLKLVVTKWDDQPAELQMRAGTTP